MSMLLHGGVIWCPVVNYLTAFDHYSPLCEWFHRSKGMGD